MESERTDQNLRNGPLKADPEGTPDTQDPKTKGTAYHKDLKDLEDEPGENREEAPGKP
jgi:hypothetical protein